MTYLQYSDGQGDGRMKYVKYYMNVSYMCLKYVCMYVRSYVHAL